ncbi:MAG: hypothetical protein WB421_13850 [Terriglobales bacterium]
MTNTTSINNRYSMDNFLERGDPKRSRSDSENNAMTIVVDEEPIIENGESMQEEESCIKILNDKWAARQAEFRSRKPDLMAGLNNVDDREHLIFSGKNLPDAKFLIQATLRKLGCTVPFLVSVAAVKTLPASAAGIQPLVRVLLESPMPEGIKDAIANGTLTNGTNTWGVRRGHSPRMPNPKTWSIQAQCPREQLPELWADVLSNLRFLYRKAKNAEAKYGEYNEKDVLLRPGSWSGDLNSSHWVQLECSDRGLVPAITAAILEMERFWPLKNRNENAMHPAILPGHPQGRLHLRGFKATVAQADVRLLAQQYGEVNFVEVHYTENNPPTATVIMRSLPDAVRMRADLDGYDASTTISQGPLVVIPQPWIAAADHSRFDVECFICKAGNHSPDRCPNLYRSRGVIHDRRPAESQRLPVGHRCAHCLQIECSVPCSWSWEWSELNSMELFVRGSEDPANAVDLTEDTHEVLQLKPSASAAQNESVTMRASYMSSLTGKRAEAPVVAASGNQQEQTSVGPVGVVGNSPVVTVALTGDHLLPGSAVNSSPLTVTGGKAC